jgi:hypothetical protein
MNAGCPKVYAIIDENRDSQVRLSTIAVVIRNVSRNGTPARYSFVVKCNCIMSATNSMFESFISIVFHVLGND